MEAERAVVVFWAAYWAIWHRAFPRLHKRAHWHIVSHLCGRPAHEAAAGAPLGEVFGMIRQVLLLEDATVRERVGELVADEYCMVDPPGRALSARTTLAPTPTLIARYDATLLALLAALGDAAPALDGALVPAAPPRLDAALRADALVALDIITQHWSRFLDSWFTARALSSARRVEARRNLLSTSHRTLMLLAVQDHYGLLLPADPEGIMADRMAAILLELTGQNFQTTRDHIAQLMQLGLLDRRAGRALRLSLAEAAVPHMRQSLGEAAAALASVAARVAAPDPHAHRLQLTVAGEKPRMVVMRDFPFTIGRVAGNTLELASSDVSRQHCRIELQDGAVCITDLGSTNGTVVNGVKIATATRLSAGVLIRLGKHELTYIAPTPVRDAADDATVTAQATGLLPSR